MYFKALKAKKRASLQVIGDWLAFECTKETSPKKWLFGNSILPKRGFFLLFLEKILERIPLKVAERTERLWKSGSVRLCVRIFTAKGNN
ncbi:hypothetical protein PWYN_26095 [Paenibacillus wynnii]|uniref:Uncharacterized protein n=1 Tax=Paenibacillus wynnii TaxID=268407 RepID=A0A098M630_9BACL|nr:hypothetical protein PWYN_26095 [Paenibacillus wynnii]